MAVVPASPNTFEASQTEPCQAVMPLSTGEMDQWINDSPRNPDLSEYAVGNCALMLQTIPSYSHPAEHGNAALWSGEEAWPANQGWTDFNCQCGEGGGSGAECASFCLETSQGSYLQSMPPKHASGACFGVGPSACFGCPFWHLGCRHAPMCPSQHWAVSMLRFVRLRSSALDSGSHQSSLRTFLMVLPLYIICNN